MVFKVFCKLFDLLGKFHGFLQKSDLQAYFRTQVNICYKCAFRHGVACTSTLYREHFLVHGLVLMQLGQKRVSCSISAKMRNPEAFKIMYSRKLSKFSLKSYNNICAQPFVSRVVSSKHNLCKKAVTFFNIKFFDYKSLAFF